MGGGSPLGFVCLIALARAFAGVRAMLAPPPVGAPFRTGNARARLALFMKGAPCFAGACRAFLRVVIAVSGRLHIRWLPGRLAAGAFPAAS